MTFSNVEMGDIKFVGDLMDAKSITYEPELPDYPVDSNGEYYIPWSSSVEFTAECEGSLFESDLFKQLTGYDKALVYQFTTASTDTFAGRKGKRMRVTFGWRVDPNSATMDKDSITVNVGLKEPHIEVMHMPKHKRRRLIRRVYENHQRRTY